MLFRSLLITSLIFTNVSMAQSLEDTIQPKTPKKIAVFADAAAFLLKGAGVKGTYSITPNLALGALVGKYELGSSGSMNDGVFDPINEVTSYGVMANYFLNSADVAGPYGSVAYVNHKVETTVNGSLANGAKAEDESSGIQVKGGYQFLGQIIPQFDLLFQLGLGYGPGGCN